MYLVDLGTLSFTRRLLLSAIGSTIMSMTYGVDVKETDDPLIGLAEAATESASQAIIPGAFLVDMIPILKYIPEFVPGTGFQKQARIWRKVQEDSKERPYLASIEAMVPFCVIFHFMMNWADFF